MNKQLNTTSAQNLTHDIMGEFWETSNGGLFTKKFCSAEFKIHHSSTGSSSLDELQKRMSHNAEFYSKRKLILHDSMLVDDKITARYTMNGVDSVTHNPITFDFVEIYAIENNLITEAWIMGDLSYGSKYHDINSSELQTNNAMETKRQQITELRNAINQNLVGTKLSHRQTECLMYLVAGYTAKEIAQMMGLSYRTVEYYVSIIKSKHDCQSKKELIRKIMPENHNLFPMLPFYERDLFASNSERWQ